MLKDLNEEQLKAASHLSGPLVVFAGAGSGKTRIITRRIAHLIDQGAMPWEILAVTFTNKAAQEMRERVLKLSFEANRCHISTFHSACARWLREFAVELGFTSNFTIYDDADATAALKKVVKEVITNAELAPILAEMKVFLHKVKTQGLMPGDVERLANEYHRMIPNGGVAIYRRYQEYLASCNAMDFGDLILNMLLLLRQNAKVRAALQGRYSYVLVDEFQDTNPSQLELIKIICAQHENLFVVGDDDQSIYSWRGATPSNILNFEKLYPASKRVILSQNYRSTSNIVAAASAMIAHNQARAIKTLYSKIPEGEAIEFHLEADAECEAIYVTESIRKELIKYDYSDFAIFYRTNAQSRLLEEALRREKIPYRIFGAMKFYERLEIKDMLAYFKLIVNEDDDVSLKRIINTPARGIGKKAVEEIEQKANQLGVSMMKAIRQMAAEPKTGKKNASKWNIFLTIFLTLKEQLSASPLHQAGNLLLEILDYKNYLKHKFPEEFLDKNENIHELCSALASFAEREPQATLADWLQTVTLSRDEEEDGIKGVSLMTLHMAKGLEFKRVFITGVEEGILPHRNNIEKQDLLEEERRLFYVGMTRAMERLSLLAAIERQVFDQFQRNNVSRFLEEIPKQHLKLDDSYFAISGASSVRYDYDEEENIKSWAKGVNVMHPAYGKGVIQEVERRLGQAKAVVKFFEFGLRKVSLSQLYPFHD